MLEVLQEFLQMGPATQADLPLWPLWLATTLAAALILDRRPGE